MFRLALASSGVRALIVTGSQEQDSLTALLLLSESQVHGVISGTAEAKRTIIRLKKKNRKEKLELKIQLYSITMFNNTGCSSLHSSRQECYVLLLCI